jgi:hypothetical protein
MGSTLIRSAAAGFFVLALCLGFATGADADRARRSAAPAGRSA